LVPKCAGAAAGGIGAAVYYAQFAPQNARKGPA